MNRYLKLLHLEVARFWKLYLSLFAITLLMQGSGIYYESGKYVSSVQDKMGPAIDTYGKYAAANGVVSFLDILSSANLWFLAPIALSIGALSLYIFFIWYREWTGKNMFIYRLLMLPTERRNMYLAKLSAILLFVLGLVSFQILILPLLQSLYQSVIDPVLRGDAESMMTIVQSHSLLRILIPSNFTEFVLWYGGGAVFVIVLFTAILLERSYRLKGIVAGLIYIGIAILLMAAPYLITNRDNYDYLYPSELFTIEFVIAILIGAMSLLISFILINKKISV
ncbi:hypothetical protein A8990_10257 [Paenibacillus taihuensis]|uniref:ABC-2 family transporter n=1 Tax=Paenibacillus taihuensis TaxID=1156355 RepID=A0A3D9SJC2_9BACL|nr:hypothetical protein [Paenibacillus taihuensis]REE92973.1 hypothetical protein A8990_10257 [Paenibacillus taihuensis]